MTILINGETREFEAGTTLQGLIDALGLEGKVMAAAVNMEIVKQAQWAQHVLDEDDRVELLDFVGGG